jgi:hypothetical protein
MNVRAICLLACTMFSCGNVAATGGGPGSAGSLGIEGGTSGGGVTGGAVGTGGAAGAPWPGTGGSSASATGGAAGAPATGGTAGTGGALGCAPQGVPLYCYITLSSVPRKCSSGWVCTIGTDGVGRISQPAGSQDSLCGCFEPSGSELPCAPGTTCPAP